MKKKIYDHACDMLNIRYDILIENISVNYCEISDLNLKEKIWIFKNYYYFIENKSCLDFIEKSQKILNNEDLVISIIILKSFLDKQYFKKLDYTKSDDIYNYVCDQYFKYMIINKKYDSIKKMNVNMLYLLDLHVNDGVIDQKNIYVTGDKFKSYKYYYLKEVYCEKPLFNYFNYSYIDFELLEYNDTYYITTFHYSKTFEVNKKNFNSNKSFKIKNLTYMMKKINTKVYVDCELVKDIRDRIGCNKEELCALIEEKQNLLQIFFNKNLWSSNTKNELSSTQKKISELVNTLITIEFLNSNIGDDFIIFPLFTDFRGRKYYHSKIGPTESKILRLVYYYGYYNLEDFDEENNTYSKKYYKKIDELCYIYNWINDKRFYEAYFWCLIGIGKICNNHDRSCLSPEDFIEYASIYLNDKKPLKIEDEIEIINYLNIVKSFKDTRIKKRSIIKDATASINQIFMKKIGPLNQSSLNYVNLGSDHIWHDTYLIYRDKFYDTVVNNKKYEEFHNIEKFNNIFARKLIKKTIMIIPYSAGEKKCWKEYIETLKSVNSKINIDTGLRSIFNLFYIFIKKTMQEKYLYKKNTQTIIDEINKEFESLRKYVLESETGEADISCYKHKKSSMDKKYKINGVKKRVTKLVLTISDALDIDSFNRSSGANTAHFTDADEIRELELLLGYCIITIHDSYLIDFNNCSKLINVKINHYQKIMDNFGNYKVKNMFILL